MAGKSLIDRAVALFGSRAAAARAAGISGYAAGQSARGELTGSRRSDVNAGLRAAIDAAKSITGGKSDPIARAIGSVSKSALSEATGLKKSEIDRAARGKLKAAERDRVEKTIAKFERSKAGKQAFVDATAKGKAIDRRGLQNVPAIKSKNEQTREAREEKAYRKIEDKIGVPWEVIKDIADLHKELNQQFSAVYQEWKRLPDGARKDELYKKLGDIAQRAKNVEKSKEFQSVVSAGIMKDEYMFSHDGEMIEEEPSFFTPAGSIIREGD